jgi:tetratricopeptide (TPR) repeat protein
VVLEAPDSVFLARVLVGGLNIAAEASLALKKWEVGLGILTELEETERAMGEGMHSLAMTRFNWHGPLLRLGRFVEAEEVLESCLAAFRGVGDLPSEATTISALADLWDERGERKQAIGLGRQALAVRNRLSNLEDRAVSHSNLASYLHRLGIVEEDAQHRLAAISYALVVRHYRLLEHNLRNLAIDMREAAASGGSYELPRLAELLACPEFEPLRRTLTEWKVAVEELQAEIDQRVEEVRRRVAEAGEAGE